jgi:hypothetical protein
MEHFRGKTFFHRGRDHAHAPPIAGPAIGKADGLEPLPTIGFAQIPRAAFEIPEVRMLHLLSLSVSHPANSTSLKILIRGFPDRIFIALANDAPPITFLVFPTSPTDQIRNANIPTRSLPFIDGNRFQIQIFLTHVYIAALFGVFHGYPCIRLNSPM